MANSLPRRRPSAFPADIRRLDAVPVDERPIVLMLARDFQEGAEVCGPAQSISQMAALLGERIRFRVITRSSPCEVPGHWSKFLGVEQLGLASRGLRVGGLAKAISETPHDLLVMNSFFDPQFTIAPLVFRRLGMLPPRPVLLAPRGEFSPGALALKPAKKSAYIALAKGMGLLRGVTFQATGEEEKDFVRRTIGSGALVLQGPNLRQPRKAAPYRPRGPGKPLRVSFISRIDVKKNLSFAIKCAAGAAFPTDFTIYGPITDQLHWDACQKAMAAAPAHVRIVYGGVLRQDEVIEVLSRTDLFFLPTLGENYGHAIVDALIAGAPVLISNRTPWRHLEQAGAGWDIPLEEKSRFVAAINRAAALSTEELLEMRTQARAFFHQFESSTDPVGQMLACLEQAMARNVAPADGMRR